MALTVMMEMQCPFENCMFKIKNNIRMLVTRLENGPQRLKHVT